jgi:hypothetical protein
MKMLKYTVSLIAVLLFIACNNDDLIDLIDVDGPTNISADFSIKQDNSGRVTITPNADSASLFDIYFGDGTGEYATVQIGESVERIYSEGTYNVRIVAKSINGKTAEGESQLVVSFRPPENLVVNIDYDPENNFKISVSATADYAALFNVYFGDVADEEPTPLMIGETIDHIYDEVGEYQLTVVALSGGESTTEVTETVNIVNPLTLPIYFEDETLDYTFVDFGNVVSEVVDNPYVNSNNESSRVGQSFKPVGAEVWGGSFLELDEPIDFSSLNNISVKVWSPVSGIVVKLKLENSDASVTYEVDVTNTIANDWEILTYNFANAPDADYIRVVLFFDFDNEGNDSYYYFDDIMLDQSNSNVYELYENFEGTPPVFEDFGNVGPTEVVANPLIDAVNETANVAKFIKASGSETWGGTFFELSDYYIEFSGSKKMRFKSFSPETGKVVKLKIENSDASVTHEVDAVTTVSNGWELLTYDFIDAPEAQYTRIVVFYDFGNIGDGTEYYFDEMEVSEGSLISTIPPSPIEDFEGTPPVFTSFGNMDPTEIVSNPDNSGINTSALSAKQVKTAGAETWAGTFFEVSSPLDLDTYNKVRMLIHSPISGAVMKLKLENADASITYEVDIVNNLTDQWEEFRFNFSEAPDADYIRIVVFFDFGNYGDGSTYYFDEIQLTN